MQTLLQVIRTLEGLARQDPAVQTIIPNDVFRLNARQDVKYGVFAWTQREHRENIGDGFLTVSLALFYVDRLTADKRNEMEVQSVGVAVLGDLLRRAEGAGLYVSGDVRYNTFNQRFEDECAGVFATVNLQAPLDYICPDEEWWKEDNSNDNENNG